MKTLSLVLTSFLLLSQADPDNKMCHLTGRVIDRPGAKLLLKKQVEDTRNHGTEVLIDSNGFFDYDLSYSHLEAYELIFKNELENGSWRPVLFFPEKDTISFVLYPMQMSDSNKISGSPLTLKGKQYDKMVYSKYFEQYTYWYGKTDSLDAIKESKSEYARYVTNKIDSIFNDLAFFEFGYAVNEMNVFGYYMFLEILRTEKDRHLIPLDTLNKYQDLFKGAFPDHPYNQIAQYRIEGLKSLQVGGRYVDFTAPDSSGLSITLSHMITINQITLIDLWAPWCGPCINKSQKTVPLFTEFKDSGFGVIGVVGGISSQDQFLRATRQHPYPWIQLSEINDAGNIWEKYGISKSGGSQFLVNNKGMILSINPSSDELRINILNEIKE